MTAVWIGVVLVVVVALCFALAYWAPRFIASRADATDWPEDAPGTGWLEADRPFDYEPIYRAMIADHPDVARTMRAAQRPRVQAVFHANTSKFAAQMAQMSRAYEQAARDFGTRFAAALGVDAEQESKP